MLLNFVFSLDYFEKPKQTLENEIFQLQNNVPNGILNKAYIEFEKPSSLCEGGS